MPRAAEEAKPPSPLPPYRALVKDPDVEEWVDLYWHRPAAYVLVVRPALSLGFVRPAHLTLLSLLWGLLGAALSWHGVREPWGFAAGAACIWLSVLFDCADGMLARAQGGGSRFGMLLDGIVDAVVGVAYWAALALATDRVLHQGWAWPAMVAILLSIWLHAALYDAYKNRFLEGVSGRPVHPDIQQVRRSAGVFQRFGEWLYRHSYVALGEALGLGRMPEVPPERFRAAFRIPMRRMSWMGLGSHLAVMYTAGALCALWPTAAFWVGLLGPTLLGNAWMLLAIASWNRAASRLRWELRAEGAAAGGPEAERPVG